MQMGIQMFEKTNQGQYMKSIPRIDPSNAHVKPPSVVRLCFQDTRLNFMAAILERPAAMKPPMG